MKKNTIRLLSVLLAFIMGIMSSIHVSAYELHENVTAAITGVYFGNVRITCSYNENGDTVFCEYSDDQLTQRNTIPCDDEGIVIREFFSETGLNTGRDVLYANEVGNIRKETIAVPYVSSGYEDFGIIEYRIVDPWGEMQYPELVANLKTSYSNRTSYQINGWTGAVIDLVSLLVSAKIGVAIHVTSFVESLLMCLGVSVTSGVVKSAVTATVASTKTSYTWQIYDSVLKQECFVDGQRNNITEEGNHYGKVYYSGITPNDWRTYKMASEFYNQLYSYSTWAVNTWMATGDNAYLGNKEGITE